MESDSVDSLITDPPAGISFMNKSWDSDKGGSKQWISWMSEVMRECLRVLKPGAHGLVWAIPRTSHWTATACEEAGFEIRDVVTHLFGSGFPKSLDISKAIDKAAGVEGEIIGKNPAYRERQLDHDASWPTPMRPEFKRGAATPEAKQWQGWGTALKPSAEFWWLIRKPLSEKTVAANVLKWGVGGLNIDQSRIGTTDKYSYERTGGSKIHGGGMDIERSAESHPQGRFPANLVLSHNPDCVEVGTKKVKLNGSGKCSGNTTPDKSMFGIGSHELSHGNGDGTETVAAWECTPGCSVAMLDEQSGIKQGLGKVTIGGTPRKTTGHIATGSPDRSKALMNYGDSGGASRFFYVAKASRSDKGEGNVHPTVKSTKLMQYLIRLITPPGGLVLDPFAGSGSTGVAAKKLGFRFIGIEKEADYVAIANARMEG